VIARNYVGASVTAFAVLVCGVSLWTNPAIAATGYGLTDSFRTEGAGALKEPSGLAIDNASGDIYVADKGNDRVLRFSSSQAFVSTWGWGVSDGAETPEVCLATCQVGLGGSGEGQLLEPEAIAIDNDPSSPSFEALYVITGHNRIEKFDPEGAYIGQITGTSSGSFGTLDGISVDTNGALWIYEDSNQIDKCKAALLNECSQQWSTGHEASPGFVVDSEGNVYVLRGEPNVDEFTGAGTELGNVTTCGCGTALAVDDANDLFVDEGTSIAKYDFPVEPLAAPQPAATFGLRDLSGGSGLAVSLTGAVYVADSLADKVDVFTEGPTPPVPHTDTAAPVTASSATLNGDLNPAGESLDYYFSYQAGTSCVGEGSTTTQSDPPNGPEHPVTGTSDVAESDEVTGLHPSTEYAACFVAENAFGSTDGPAVTFITGGVPPAIDSESAEAITQTEATLEAQIDPNNQASTWHFEYSTSPSLTSPSSTSHEERYSSPFGGELTVRERDLNV
jgi:hypothetical protein